MKTIFILLMGLTSTLTSANEIFKHADIAAGKKLLEAHCIQCHASSYGGDGAEIYTRELRKIKTSNGLLAQVRNCNTMLNLKWFEEDEINTAAYLNQMYYKFDH